jgi:hypothetical protein
MSTTGTAHVPGREKYSVAKPGDRLDPETKERVLLTLSFYNPNRKGCRACAYELKRQGIEISESALYYYISNKKKRMELEEVRQKALSQVVRVPCFHRGYRLMQLQDIIEDKDVKAREKVQAIKEARTEANEFEMGKKMGSAVINAMPESVKRELESQCEKILDAEYEVVEDDPKQMNFNVSDENDSVSANEDSKGT